MFEKEINDVINTIGEATVDQYNFDAQSVFGPLNENKVTEEIDAENEETEDEKIIYGETFNYTPTAKDKVKSVLGTIRKVCCFSTVFSTIGITMIYAASDNGIVVAIGFIAAIIGFISSLLACPLRLIMFGLGIMGAGFTIGLSFFGIGCVFGLIIGLFIALLVVFYCPAAVTLHYFFTELKDEF